MKEREKKRVIVASIRAFLSTAKIVVSVVCILVPLYLDKGRVYHPLHHPRSCRCLFIIIELNDCESIKSD